MDKLLVSFLLFVASGLVFFLMVVPCMEYCDSLQTCNSYAPCGEVSLVSHLLLIASLGFFFFWFKQSEKGAARWKKQ